MAKLLDSWEVPVANFADISDYVKLPLPNTMNGNQFLEHNGGSLVWTNESELNNRLNFLPLTGGTLTGDLNLLSSNINLPVTSTANNFVRTAIITGQNDASTRQRAKAHSIELGVANRDYLMFNEYGGNFRFYKTNKAYLAESGDGDLIAQITSDGIYENGQRVYSPNNKPSPADIGAVPTTRTINGKALSGNINITSSDIGALSLTVIPFSVGPTGSSTPAHYSESSPLTYKMPDKFIPLYIDISFIAYGNYTSYGTQSVVWNTTRYTNAPTLTAYHRYNLNAASTSVSMSSITSTAYYYMSVWNGNVRIWCAASNSSSTSQVQIYQVRGTIRGIQLS